MSITLGINSASLSALRHYGNATDSLQENFKRFSSGLRVNTAGDDAAGLAIASNLRVDARVYNQGIRNLADGISLLNIAEDAVTGLKNILERIRELATQAANGILTDTQRAPLDDEAQALVDEYTRILGVTAFNGRYLLDGNLSNLTLQAGYGNTGQIALSVGQQIVQDFGVSTSSTVGDGTFKAAVTYSGANNPRGLTAADLNGDGILDLATAEYSGTNVSIYLGNGNGTFKARRTYQIIGQGADVRAADLNMDGYLDLAVTRNNATGRLSILLNNGNGTFKAYTSFTTTGFATESRLADFNSDSVADIVTVNEGGAVGITVRLNNGNGSFKSSVQYATPNYPLSVAVADFNNDGTNDIIAGLYNSPYGVSVFLGNGNGTFKAGVTTANHGGNTRAVAAGDLNNDGKIDIVDFSSDSFLHSALGNGDGRFQAYRSYAGPTASNNIFDTVSLADLNGDGNLDALLSAQTTSSVSIFLGNGNGTFRARTTLATNGSPANSLAADLNSDGALDIVACTNSQFVNVFMGNTQTLVSLAGISLHTQSSALASMSTLDDALTAAKNELGTIGALQSRIQVASSTHTTSVELSETAASQILDIDTAQEVTNMLRHQILQQSAQAVLAQAIKFPKLVLSLLNFSASKR